MKHVQKYLKSEREKQGLTQGDLSKKTGIVQNTFCRIENRHISTKTLEKVLKGLGISIHTSPEIADKIEERMKSKGFEVRKQPTGEVVILDGGKVYCVSSWISQVFG